MTAMIGAVSGVSATSGVSPLSQLTAATQVSKADESAFSSALAGAVENIQNRQDVASDLGVKAVTGELDDVHDYTIAATEAAVTLELAATVRNRLVDAFSEIMRMQA